MKKLNIAMIGSGIMCKYHSYAFKIVGHFFDVNVETNLQLMISRFKGKEKEKISKKYGFENFSNNVEDAFSDEIDIVDIVTPNNSHIDLVIEALRRNKMVICEKPLAMNYREALKAIKEVERSNGLPLYHCVNFNYRKATPIALLKRIIDDGEIGEIYTFKIDFLDDSVCDRDLPIDWRLGKKYSGGGASYDLNVHSIDLAHYLIGEIENLVSLEKIFIKKRKSEDLKSIVPVDTDDYCVCIANFRNGAVGVFDSSRVSTGDKLQNTIEIRGSKGAVKWNYQKFNLIEFYSTKDKSDINGFKKVYVTENTHPYMNGYYGMPGHGNHYNSMMIHQVYDFLKAIEEEKTPSPNLYDGLKAQMVLEAIKISNNEKKWIKITDIA
jgi:predicted dehydrogenase